MCAANTVTAWKSRSPWSPRARWSNDDSWSGFAQTAGVSQVNTTARIPVWTSLSSNNSTLSTGKFRRALPYADEQHPRRIRGPITDHELDHFRRDRLRLRNAGGPDKDTNELYRSLTVEELTVVRVWSDRVLQDAQSASSVLTDEILNCIIRLLHKGGDTSDKPSDWSPIGLLNVGIKLVHQAKMATP